MKTLTAVGLGALCALLGFQGVLASEHDREWEGLSLKESSCGVAPNLPFYLQFPPDFEATDLGWDGCLWGTQSDRKLLKVKKRKVWLQAKRIQQGLFWFRVIPPGEPFSWVPGEQKFLYEDSLESFAAERGATEATGTMAERAGYPTLLVEYENREGTPGYVLYVGNLNDGYANSIEYFPPVGAVNADEVWNRFLGSISGQPLAFRNLPLPPENLLEETLATYKAGDYKALLRLESRVPAGDGPAVGRISQEIAIEYKAGSFVSLRTDFSTERSELAALEYGTFADLEGIWSQPNGKYSLDRDARGYTGVGPKGTALLTSDERLALEAERLPWLKALLGLPYISSIGLDALLGAIVGLYDFRVLEDTEAKIVLEGAVRQRDEISVVQADPGVLALLETFRRRLPRVDLVVGKHPPRIREFVFSGRTAKLPLSVRLELAAFDIEPDQVEQGHRTSASTPPPDFSTPEKALRQLENAYRREDIEAAVAAKDFRTQARLKLRDGSPEDAANEAEWEGLLDYAAEVLETAYRKALRESGFPDFVHVSCRITKKEPHLPGVVILTDACEHPGGAPPRDRPSFLVTLRP